MEEENRGFNTEGKKSSFYGIPAKLAVSIGQIVCVFVFALSIGILLLLGSSGMSMDEVGEAGQYVDTSDCAQKMFDYVNEISYDLQNSRRFEKDGVLNGKQKIDITFDEIWSDNLAIPDEASMNPETSYTVTQLQKIYDSGLADELSGLFTRYQNNDFGREGYGGNNGYYYSRMSKDYLEDDGSEYSKEVIEEAVAAALKEAEPADDQVNTPLNLTTSEIELARKIKEVSGESVTSFSDAFLYMFERGEVLEQRNEKNAAGGTLAEYAAKNKENVSLEELYGRLLEASNVFEHYISTENLVNNYYVNSNIRYYIKDKNNNVYTNVAEWKNDVDAMDKEDAESELYIRYQRKDGILTDVEQKGENTVAGRYLKNILTNHPVIDKNETIFLGLNTDFPYHDDIYQLAKTYDTYLPWAKLFVGSAVISFVFWLVLFVLGTIQAGRNPYSKRIQLYSLDRLPTEVGLALGIICGGLAITLGLMSLVSSVENEVSVWVLALAAAILTACYGLCLVIYYSLVRRIKGKNLWNNSLLNSIISLCKNVYAARNTSTKLILVFGGFVLIHIILLSNSSGFDLLLCLIIDAVVLLYMIREASGRENVMEGLQQIGSGDLDYKVDTTNLIGDNLRLAETVNRVGDGLQAAVKEKMKSERLKADLITNVSHDIKTPLTSIINYVDLLKRENIQNPTIKGYIDVLDVKSQRLKQLTEDLVEASKVSSGNVKLEFITLNLNELVQQMNGEFDERFNKSNISVVSKLPREPLRISADGRSIWRVLENLYSNVAKYAMPGTRVYIETEKRAGNVILTMKNISENPLNISAEELTERFIRGDVSRSTEGSGLGLSIAQNLTRLQHGTFKIYLDGDLFKVTLTFKEVEEPIKSDSSMSGESMEPPEKETEDVVSEDNINSYQ